MSWFPIRFIPATTTFRFMEQRWVGFILSIALIVGSLVTIWMNGLNFGIDFTGGILIEARFEREPDLSILRSGLSDALQRDISLQQYGTGHDIMIRVGVEEDEEAQQAEMVKTIKAIIGQHFVEKIDYRKIDYVGPQVGAELIRGGWIAISCAFLAIILYLWVRFEWQYGLGAILSLIHDAIVVVGFLSLTGLEFNLTSIAAVLTVIGYSVNDSVVIYDRIRENLRKFKSKRFDHLLNQSINETLSRTLLTVLTTLLATGALIVFGGEVIRSFSYAVTFGIIIGTYSSIYVSVPILIYFNVKKAQRSV